MKKLNAILVCMSFFAATAGAETAEESARVAEYCGNNLACYFSSDELAKAFGPMAVDLGMADLLKMSAMNYAVEDSNVEQSVQQSEVNELINKQQGLVSVENKSIDKKAADKKEEAKKAAEKAKNAPLSYTGISPRGYPIWSSFVGKFKQCAPGCAPYIVSVNRPGAYSCHNGGRAIDVGAIVCGGTKHSAINGGKFTSFAGCMKGKMKTLYRNGNPATEGVTAAHYDHAHFSNGCTVAGGRRYY